jgi:hypothetical protein
MVKLKRLPRMMAVVGGGIICIANARISSAPARLNCFILDRPRWSFKVG